MPGPTIYSTDPKLSNKIGFVGLIVVFVILTGQFLWRLIFTSPSSPYQYTIGFITSDLTKKSDSISVRYQVGTNWYSLKNALPNDEVNKLLQSQQRLYVKFEKNNPQRASLLFTPLPNAQSFQAGEILDSVFTSRYEN